MSRDKDQMFKSTTLKFYLKLYVDTGPVTPIPPPPPHTRKQEGGSRVQVLSLAQVRAPLPSHTVLEVESLD